MAAPEVGVGGSPGGLRPPQLPGTKFMRPPRELPSCRQGRGEVVLWDTRLRGKYDIIEQAGVANAAVLTRRSSQAKDRSPGSPVQACRDLEAQLTN